MTRRVSPSALAPLKAWSGRVLRSLGRRDRTEVLLLTGALAVIVLVFAAFALAGHVVEGSTQQFDERILRALRKADDPDTPVGPRWLPTAALDVTALGSAAVLGLTVVAIVGFLLLQGMYRTAAFVFVASAGGWLLNSILKQLVGRARPSVVPHLREVMTLSFPSGHAMTSAAVYLTLGALTMRVAKRPVTKVYCMMVAILVTTLIGASRVYLGVHYPTDVLAGWIMGLSWALLCWIVERLVERRAGIRRETQGRTS